MIKTLSVCAAGLLLLAVSSIYANDDIFIAPQQQVVVPRKQISIRSDLYLGQDGYYSMQNLQAQRRMQEQMQKSQEQYDDKLNTLIDQQKQITNLLGKVVELLGGEKPSTPEEPPTDNDPGPVNPPEGGDDIPEPNPGANPNQPTDLDRKVFDIVKTNCARCHTGEDSRGGFKILERVDGTALLLDLFVEERVLIYDSVANINLKNRGKKLMPLGGQMLPEDDIETLRLWMVEAAEELVYNTNGQN